MLYLSYAYSRVHSTIPLFSTNIGKFSQKSPEIGSKFLIFKRKMHFLNKIQCKFNWCVLHGFIPPLSWIGSWIVHLKLSFPISPTLLNLLILLWIWENILNFQLILILNYFRISKFNEQTHSQIFAVFRSFSRNIRKFRSFSVLFATQISRFFGPCRESLWFERFPTP